MNSVEDNDFVLVWRFIGASEAYLWKQRLKAAGIRAVIMHNERYGKMELWVKSEDSEAALALLKENATKYTFRIGSWKRWMTLFSMGGLFIAMAVLFYFTMEDKTASIIALIAGLSVTGIIVYFMLPEKKK